LKQTERCADASFAAEGVALDVLDVLDALDALAVAVVGVREAAGVAAAAAGVALPELSSAANAAIDQALSSAAETHDVKRFIWATPLFRSV
jgi:hypothetical protein